MPDESTEIIMESSIKCEINPPFNYSGTDFSEALKKEFNNLKNLISLYNDIHENIYRDEILKITKFQNEMLNIINMYFSGKSGKEYIKFEKLLSKSIINDKVDFFTNIDIGHILYKARIENIDQIHPFTNEDMFHIPFEQRAKVKSHRFSISGLPCLYMSDSVYTCWLELNRPPVDRFIVASFLVSEYVRVFDLCKLYSTLKSKIIANIINYGEILSLFIACSFTQNASNDEFKPEYIIPQFLMQWLLDNNYNIRGIKYFTHKDKIDSDNKRLYTNFVFPAL